MHSSGYGINFNSVNELPCRKIQKLKGKTETQIHIEILKFLVLSQYMEMFPAGNTVNMTM